MPGAASTCGKAIARSAAHVTSTRERLYRRNFGAHHVVFRVLALLEDINACERRVLQELDPWRMRGRTGRKNEWLEGIDADEVLTRVMWAVREHETPGR